MLYELKIDISQNRLSEVRASKVTSEVSMDKQKFERPKKAQSRMWGTIWDFGFGPNYRFSTHIP